MTFVDELESLPSAANGMTTIHVNFLSSLLARNDRGGFYLAYYQMVSEMAGITVTGLR